MSALNPKQFAATAALLSAVAVAAWAVSDSPLPPLRAVPPRAASLPVPPPPVDVSPLLPLAAHDEAGGQLLAENERLVREIGEQLAARRALLAELARARKPENPLAEVNQELERELAGARRKTEPLREEVEAAGKR